jgi:phosphoenolpyruvate synthase/pyruvate phosphate dikinase
MHEHLIQVAPGPGENTVSGDMNADTFTLDRSSGKVKSLRAEHMLMSPEEVQHVHQMLHQAADEFHWPQDIEWAKDSKTGQIYFLQSRDLTQGIDSNEAKRMYGRD